MRRLSLALGVTLLAIPNVVSAQDHTPVSTDGMRHIRLAIDRESTRLLPSLDPLRQDAVALARPRAGAQRATYRRGFVGRHPILVGAVIGFGAGAVIGVTKACGGPPDRESYCGPATVGFGAVGAGLGALVGYRLAD